MSRKKSLLIGLSLISIFSLSFLLASWDTVSAEETRLIRLYGSGTPAMGQIIIEPENLTVNKGTVVVWLNWVRAEDVQVKFEDGKTCDDVTDAPSNFKMDLNGCYVTSWIKMGSTSSLKFNEKGTFHYTVERGIKGVKSTGRIIVR